MSEHTTITDRINALRPYPDSGFGELVKLSDVLEIVKNAVPVEIDPTMYADEHVDVLVERDRKTLAVVSTVYNLLADTAAEFATQHVRAKMGARGMNLFSDAEMFQINREAGDGATSYRDLACRSEAVVMAIGELFDFLENASIEQAELGLQMSDAALGVDSEDMSLEGLAKALDIHFGEEQ